MVASFPIAKVTVAVVAALSQAWRLGIAVISLGPSLQRRQERLLAAQFEAAYRNTDYVIHELETTLRIDASSPAVDALLREVGVRNAVFLTAWNPRSQSLSKAENEMRNNLLLKRIHQLGQYRVLAGEGRGRGGGWIPERSFLVLGMPRRDANHLADEFNQNAYVHYNARGVAKLVWRAPQGRLQPGARQTPVHSNARS